MQLRRKATDDDPFGPTPNVTFEVTREGTGVRVNAFRIGFMGAIGVLVALVAGAIVRELSTVLVYIGVALFLALGIDPLVSFLERFIPRWTAILAVVVGVLAAFAGVIFAVVPILIDPGMGIKNLKICLDEAQVEAFVGVPKAHVARMIFKWAPDARLSVTVGKKLFWGGAELQALPTSDAPFPTADTKASDLAAILFTSGSTGVPKGALHTHGSFETQTTLIRDLFHQLSEEDVYTRFFRRVRSLSNQEVQRLCNVNFENEVAFVAAAGPRESPQIRPASPALAVPPGTRSSAGMSLLIAGITHRRDRD